MMMAVSDDDNNDDDDEEEEQVEEEEVEENGEKLEAGRGKQARRRRAGRGTRTAVNESRRSKTVRQQQQ